MASQGPNFCGTGASVSFGGGGGVAWTNPTNVQGDTTATAATCVLNLGAPTSSAGLSCTNFGFAIPASDILGVTVEVECSASNAARSTHQDQFLVSLVGTSADKHDLTAIGTTKAFTTFGSSADRWGFSNLTWNDVNDPAFGVELVTESTVSQAVTVSFFRCRITITFSPLLPPAVDVRFAYIR